MQFPRRFRRAQRPERLRLKLKKDASRDSSVDDVFAHMKDFAGVRIATYVESDRDRVTSEVTKRFRGLPEITSTSTRRTSPRVTIALPTARSR